MSARIVGEVIEFDRDGDKIRATYRSRLIITPELADELTKDGFEPGPDYLVTQRIPDRWPADKPWPPQVTMPRVPCCWPCAVRAS